jgi:hypothetical protein
MLRAELKNDERGHLPYAAASRSRHREILSQWLAGCVGFAVRHQVAYSHNVPEARRHRVTRSAGLTPLLPRRARFPGFAKSRSVCTPTPKGAYDPRLVAKTA